MKKFLTVTVIIGVVAFVSLAAFSLNRNLSKAPEGVYLFKTATSSELGTYLVSADGLPLYTYAKDNRGLSVCTGLCALNWLPYAVSTSIPLTVESSITGTISTLTRVDGVTQITYKGKPLYIQNSALEKEGAVNELWSVVRP